jgi:rare lipoprotein A
MSGRGVVLALAAAVWSGCSPAPPPAPVRITAVEVREGLASYYAKSFDGRRTASGVAFDNDAMMAAHPTFPFGTIVRVTNLANGRSVSVRVVDRGPNRRVRREGVIIDVSRAAAKQLDFIEDGRARVRIERDAA